MARLTDLSHGKLDTPKLDPRDIIIRPNFNFRDVTTPDAQAHIAWLKQSIMANGVQEPIRVEYTDGKAYVVNGQCRVEACKQLWNEGVKIPYKDGGSGPPLVPTIQIKGDEAELLAASMIANDGLPPTKIDFGRAADRLMKLGWPIEKVSQYVPPHVGLKMNDSGKKRYVTEAVELHHAPIAVKEAVTKGVDGVTLSEGAALQIARKGRLHADEHVKAATSKAKAAGKTTVKREKQESTREKTSKTVFQLVRKLFKDVPQRVLDNEEEEFVSVDRKVLQMLYLQVNSSGAR